MRSALSSSLNPATGGPTCSSPRSARCLRSRSSPPLGAGRVSSSGSPSASAASEIWRPGPSLAEISSEQEERMGKVVVTEFITIDGVIQDPGGSQEYDRGGWSFDYNRGEEGDKFKLDELMAADAQLLGRITYEGFAAAWPTMKDEQAFADRMNSMPKYV